jgi:polysaccharide biosynthesis protein PslH
MKLFILLPRVPYPTEKGDKLRAFNQLKQLSGKHEITLCALNDSVLHEDAVRVLSTFAKNVYIIDMSKVSIYLHVLRTLFSDKPLQVGYFYNKRINRIIRSLIDKHKPDHIFCQLIRVAEYVKGIQIPKTLDYQDVFSKNVERRMNDAPFYMKPFLKMEYRRVLKYEHDVFAEFDNKLIISVPDRDLIPHPLKDQIVVVRNGVDTTFFSPLVREKEYDLVFTGNMGYPPNINGAEFLANKILPLLLPHIPDVRILIAGANPNLRVSVLKSENIEVSGWVPDMRECYAMARIFIAPMQIGTGLQNKLLEAMAMQIPCITSPLANQALQAKNNTEILIAETPEEYANHILYLLNNPEKAAQIALAGYEYILHNFSWVSETEKIEQLFQPNHSSL